MSQVQQESEHNSYAASDSVSPEHPLITPIVVTQHEQLPSPSLPTLVWQQVLARSLTTAFVASLVVQLIVLLPVAREHKEKLVMGSTGLSLVAGGSRWIATGKRHNEDIALGLAGSVGAILGGL